MEDFSPTTLLICIQLGHRSGVLVQQAQSVPLSTIEAEYRAASIAAQGS